MFAVIRLRSNISVEKKIRSTLEMMRLSVPNSCVILPDTPSVKGMLQKAKDYITWGEVSKETLSEMLKRRLRAKGTNKKVDEAALKDVSGFGSFDELSAAMLEGKARLGKIEKLQPVLRLTPPSKGFKSINDHHPRGDLGYRGKEIDGLLERMI